MKKSIFKKVKSISCSHILIEHSSYNWWSVKPPYKTDIKKLWNVEVSLKVVKEIH